MTVEEMYIAGNKQTIIQDADTLRAISEAVDPDDSGLIEDITNKLWATLYAKGENDVALSAPQIGIFKRIAVVRAKNPFVLVNPRIIETKGETFYMEGCLSFPGKSVKTKRYVNIVVEADNYPGQKLVFGPEPDDNFHISDKDLLESVAVQHEINHMDGKLMFDFQFEPIKSTKKIGRNEKVNIKNIKTGEIMEQIKYKKAEPLIEKGWELI